MVYLNVKELLEKKGKSKYWLVKNMESDYVTIGAIIDSTSTSIKFETLEKLCTLLECTPNDIIKIKKENKK